MLTVLRTVVWISVVSTVFTLKLKPFANKDEFFTFYENWLSVESPRDGPNYQTALMELLMNTTVDPCDDFYQFACGNYETAFAELEIMYTDLRRHARYAERKIMEDMLGSEVKSSDSDVIRKLKLLYQLCSDSSTWNVADLGTFLKSLASWPWLDENWSKTKFDWINVTATAMSYELRESLFRIRHAGKNDSGIISLQLFSRFSREDLQEIQDSANEFSLDLHISDDDLTNVNNFYGEIQRIENDNDEDHDVHASYSLTELKALAEHLDFRTFLKVLHGSEHIPMESVITLIQPGTFKSFSKLVGRTDKRTIANFIFVQLLSNLSRKKLNPERCTQVVYQECVPPIMDEFWTRYTDSHGTEQIKEIFEGVREQAVEAFNDWSQDEEFINKLASSQLIAPDFEARRNTVAQFYSELAIDGNSLYNSLMNVLKIYTTHRPDYNRNLFPLYKSYVWQLMPEMGINPFGGINLVPPFFHRFSKRFGNYAGVGRWLAREMVEDIVERNNNTVPQNDLASSIKCYLEQHEAETSSSHVQYWTANIFTNVQSLSIAFRAYKKWLDGCPTTKDDIQPKGISLNAEQNFFLAITQNGCGDRDGVRNTMRMLYNSVDFKEAFSCPVGSKMSPSIACY